MSRYYCSGSLRMIRKIENCGDKKTKIKDPKNEKILVQRKTESLESQEI